MTTSTARTARKGFTLADAGREFAKHPSPWMIGATLVAALTARIIVGDWQITDALLPVVMLALFPFFEWIIHVSPALAPKASRPADHRPVAGA